MAVAVLVEAAGMTQGQYEEATKEVMPGGQLPAGLLSHLGGAMDGGWRVVDVWESAEAFEKFAHETLGPALQKAGYGQRPEIKIWPVHFTTHRH